LANPVLREARITVAGDSLFLRQHINESLNSGLIALLIFVAGMCIKAFKSGTKEKFFINICHTSEIPAPKDVTEKELHKLIEEQNASEFKVPLSITKPREGKDKSGNSVRISDVAINTEFYKKKISHGDGLFYHFVITLVFESLEQKHKIELDTTNFIQLQNRVCIDKLVEHQIYSRDVKTVEKYHAEQDANEVLGADDSDRIVIGSGETKPGKVLIQEISSKDQYKPLPATKRASKASDVEHRLISDTDQFNRRVLLAEFYLPHVQHISEVNVEVNDDRLMVESQQHGYSFDGFLPHKINANKTQAELDNDRNILKVMMSV